MHDYELKTPLYIGEKTGVKGNFLEKYTQLKIPLYILGI
jgi:hypothetical protein